MTQEEIAFLNRAAPYIEKGASIEEALRAVLSRDQELVDMATAKTRTGEAIRKGLAAKVYHEIRGRDAVARAVDGAAAIAQATGGAE